MEDSQLLQTVADLSREFGKESYVRGGGGNSSCKTEAVLLIKPSGVTLAEMTPEKFIGLSRERLAGLYGASFPGADQERESAVVAFMAGTVLPGFSGRPSVEAPLHNCFPQRFVVHTHPAVVNAMTCGADGERFCRELFPDAMWMPAIEPGYIVSMRVREELLRYQAENGKPPEMLFLANHGLFIAHDDADGVRELYRRAMRAIGAVIEKAGLAGDPPRDPQPDAARAGEIAAAVRGIIGDEAQCHAVSGRFRIPAGAISPDHIVYCKAALYSGDAGRESLTAFRRAHGYWPRVVATPEAVFGFGATQRVADLALELAWDGAQVVRYAGAFGGIRYLDARLVGFIADWEVESYRQKMAR